MGRAKLGSREGAAVNRNRKRHFNGTTTEYTPPFTKPTTTTNTLDVNGISFTPGKGTDGRTDGRGR